LSAGADQIVKLHVSNLHIVIVSVRNIIL